MSSTVQVFILYGLVALVTSVSVSKHHDFEESGTPVSILAPEKLEDVAKISRRSVHKQKHHPKRDYNAIEEVLKGIKSIASKKIVDQVGAVYQFDVKGNFIILLYTTKLRRT